MSKQVEISDENHEKAKVVAKEFDLTLGRFMDHVLEFFFERKDRVQVLSGFEEKENAEEGAAR